MIEGGPKTPLWQVYHGLLSDKDLEYTHQNRNGEYERRPVQDALSALQRADQIPTPQFGGNLADITTCGIASIGYGLGIDKLAEVLPDLQRFVGKREMLYETLRDVGNSPPAKISPKAPIEHLQRGFGTADGFLWVVHKKTDTANFDPIQDAALIEYLRSLGMKNQTRFLPHMFAGLKRPGDNPFFDVFDICGRKQDPQDIFFPMTDRQVLEHAKSYGPNLNDPGFDYPSMLVKWF